MWREIEQHEDERAELAPVILYNIHRPKNAKAITTGHFFRRQQDAELDALAIARAELDEAEALERAQGIIPVSTDPEFIRAASFARASGSGVILPDEMRGQNATR